MNVLQIINFLVREKKECYKECPIDYPALVKNECYNKCPSDYPFLVEEESQCYYEYPSDYPFPVNHYLCKNEDIQEKPIFLITENSSFYNYLGKKKFDLLIFFI